MTCSYMYVFSVVTFDMLLMVNYFKRVLFYDLYLYIKALNKLKIHL